MYDWCHSGLEGYCKSAAWLLSDRIADELIADDVDDEKRRERRESKKENDRETLLQLCRELIPDRTHKNLTRAWTFSNMRQGRSCRSSIFEKCWLGEDCWGLYLEEALLVYKGVESDGGFTTVPLASEYESRLRICTSESEAKGVATLRRETDALGMCVKRVQDLLLKDRADEVAKTDKTDEVDEISCIVSLVSMVDFPAEFFTEVMPAIERGFLSERYRPSDIQQYALTLSGQIVKAHRCLVEGETDDELAPFYKFLLTLFAGIIYGPTHPLAISRPRDVTLLGDYSYVDEEEETHENTIIRLTQVFDRRGAYTGYSELFRPAQVVFLGRSPNVSSYLEKCRDLFSGDPELLDDVLNREAVIFPIDRHDAMSNDHAMLIFQGGSWWLYDLESKNGTSIASRGGNVDVEGLKRIEPGDQLRLGAPAMAMGSNVYLDAATVLATMHVDLSEEYV